ncbi:MAG: rRNA maturation RNase YbeY [Candidatus Marinimicrobia bacterium]|nr:rRNA maturation RNase YbeY [Candidatus Neomarinimicrobiota bacterium]
MISLQIENDPDLNQINPEVVNTIVNPLFSAFEMKDASVTFIFASDEVVSDIKKEYFQVDQFTDVIAFRLDEEDEVFEGEVYISLPRAKENANTYNEPYQKEIARLIIHGSLHLLGLDDQTEKEKEEMRSKEDYYLGQVDWEKIVKVDIHD